MYYHRFVLLAVLVLVGFLFSSCTSDRQKQAASDGHAGVQAVRILIHESAPGLGPKIDPILNGIDGYIDASADAPRSEQPKPTLSPAEVIGNPVGYEKGGVDSGVKVSSGWSWEEISGVALGVAGVAAFVLRVTGAGGPVGAVLASVLENASVRRKKREGFDLQEAAQVVITEIEKQPDTNTIRDLKKAISKKAEPEHIAAIHRVKDGVVIVRAQEGVSEPSPDTRTS